LQFQDTKPDRQHQEDAVQMLLITKACKGAHNHVIVGENSSVTGFHLGLAVPVSDLVSDMASSSNEHIPQVCIDI